jgi:hypothetical protein
MRLRTATTGALVCATAAAAALSLAAPALPARPAQEVWVARCNKVLHSATFVGAMRQVKDSEGMWMRFRLLERILPGREFQPVEAAGLDEWHRSRPGVERFAFRQRVRALAEAAIYKVEVEFRWYDADGELMRQALERSRRCRQPGALPNLRVQNIVYRKNQGYYGVRVANVGRDVATGAEVRLFVDGKESETIPLPALAPEDFELLAMKGPPCVGSVQAIVDPTALVRESAEDDNALTEPCASLQDRQ